jgi:hypothetical protein
MEDAAFNDSFHDFITLTTKRMKYTITAPIPTSWMKVRLLISKSDIQTTNKTKTIQSSTEIFFIILNGCGNTVPCHIHNHLLSMVNYTMILDAYQVSELVIIGKYLQQKCPIGRFIFEVLVVK